MKEHPIIFNGEMVRAILDGHKTVTRRVIRPQPETRTIYAYGTETDWAEFSWKDYEEGIVDGPDDMIRFCPYGRPGDTLWVREAACYGFDCDGDVDGVCAYRADVDPLSDWHKYEFIPGIEAADWNGHTGWRPSIHMPRWASRLMLEVTDIRVEQVQDISCEDAKAEGGAGCYHENYECGVDEFRELWDRINAKRGFGWDTDPWVWVIEFRVKEERT